MNIGYVKKAKKIESDGIKSYFYNVLTNIKMIFNYVEKDKYKTNVFTVYNFNDKSQRKLKEKLKKNNIEALVVENNNNIINYYKIESGYLLKYMAPEIIDLCFKFVKPILDEIYICTNIFNYENVQIIESLVSKVKIVNIVSKNQNYCRLEKRLEEKGIFITVSKNRRKSLKKANIVLNLDCEDFSEYNINRHLILIDVTGKSRLPEGFNGIIIRKIRVNTKKILRVFSEFENFEKEELLEAELVKIGNYEKVRNYIDLNKIYVEELYNKKLIDNSEFKRVKELNEQKNKKNPSRLTAVRMEGG